MGITQPGQGLVSVVGGDSNADPSSPEALDRLVFTPAEDFSGTVSFSYTVEDAGGIQHTAFVTITINSGAAPPDEPGSVDQALHGGFAPAVTSPYSATAQGNYRLQDIRSENTLVTTTDDQGISQTADRTTTSSLVIVSTEGANGYWTYSETRTFTSDVVTTGGDGSIRTSSRDYDYSFSATGSSLATSYTFTASSTVDSTATFTDQWSGDDAGGEATYFRAEAVEYEITVSNTTAADGTGSGTSTGEGLVNSSYTGEGTYWHQSAAGSPLAVQVEGSMTQSGQQYYTYSFSTSASRANEVWSVAGTQNEQNEQSDHSSYSGIGVYSGTSSGVTPDGEPMPSGITSGTIAESGAANSSSLSTSQSIMDASGQWQPGGGSGTSTADGYANWSYTGTGTYSYDVAGGSVSGTITASGHQDSSYEFAGTHLLASDGAWSETAGSGLVESDGSSHFAYEGTGTYAYSADGYTVSGTIVESGSDGLTHASSISSERLADGATTEAGAASSLAQGTNSRSTSGSGTYVLTLDGGSVNGTITESASDNASYTTSTISVLGADGVWAISGATESTSNGDTSTAYAGTGAYSYVAAGGSVSGELVHGGSDSTTYAYSTTGVLDPTAGGSTAPPSTSTVDVTWPAGEEPLYRGQIAFGAADQAWKETLAGSEWITTGTGATTSEGGTNWSYTGSGTYAHTGASGSSSGTLTESGSENTSYTFATDATLADDEWTTTGTGSTSSDGDTNWEYEGSGAYSYTGEGISGSGTTTESGSESTSYEFTSELIIQPDAEGDTWVETVGTGTTTTSGDTSLSYSGSGSYAYSGGGADVTGATTESGSDNTSHSFTTTSTLAPDGTWVTTGEGTTTSDGGQSSGYLGGGTYTTEIDGGTVSGNIIENGADTSNYAFSTSSTMDAEGEWTTTGEGSTLNTGASAYSYIGDGQYTYVTDTSVINGTMTESSSDGTTYTNQTASTLGPDGEWTTTGSGSSSTIGTTSFSTVAMGTYTYETNGGTVTGTILESSDDSGTSLFTTTSTLEADGTWTTTGSGGTLNSGTTGRTYSGDGAYSYTVAGGIVSGLITESGSETGIQSSSTNSTLSADGTWSTTGTSTNTTMGTTNSSYLGNGVYTYAVTGGAVTGTINESGSQADSYESSVVSTLSDEVWMSTGTSSSSGNTTSESSYSGSGDYSYYSGGSLVTGTITEEGESSDSSSYSTEATLADDEWTTVGTASGEGGSTRSSSYSGGGSYYYATPGGSVSGTISELGGQSDTSQYATSSTLADGQWTTTGSGTGSGSSSTLWSTSGEGAYYHTALGGSVTGSIDESTSESSSNTYQTTSTLADGTWTTLGTGAGHGESESDFVYTGEGTYQYETDRGTVSGTIEESGGQHHASVQNTTSTLAPDGEWTTTGSGSGSGGSESNSSYSGTGTYAYELSNGTVVTGTLAESGEKTYLSTSTTTSNLASDTWTTTGSAHGHGTDDKDSSFSGSGDYTVAFDGGQIVGEVAESGSEHHTSSFDTHSSLANDTWTTNTGYGNGHTEIEYSWSAEGSGAYSRAGGASAISGTVVESRTLTHNLTGNTHSTYASGAWTTTGTATENATAREAREYEGSGPYIVAGANYNLVGTVTESGDNLDLRTYHADKTLAAGGNWTKTESGTQAVTQSRSSSYDASGSYSHSATDSGGDGTENWTSVTTIDTESTEGRSASSWSSNTADWSRTSAGVLSGTIARNSGTTYGGHYGHTSAGTSAIDSSRGNSASGGSTEIDHHFNTAIAKSFQHDSAATQNSTIAADGTETVTGGTVSETVTSTGQASFYDHYSSFSESHDYSPEYGSDSSESLSDLRQTTDSYQASGHLSVTIVPGDPPPDMMMLELTNHVSGTSDELSVTAWTSSGYDEMGGPWSDGGGDEMPYGSSYDETTSEDGFYWGGYHTGDSGPNFGEAWLSLGHGPPVSGSAPAYDEGRGPGKLEEGADRHGGFEGFPEGSGFTATSKGPSAYNGPSSAPPEPAAGPTMPGPSMERVIPSPVIPAAGAQNPAASGANAEAASTAASSAAAPGDMLGALNNALDRGGSLRAGSAAISGRSKVFAGDLQKTASAIADVIPLAGLDILKGYNEAYSGRDSFTGDKLSDANRAMQATGATFSLFGGPILGAFGDAAKIGRGVFGKIGKSFDSVDVVSNSVRFAPTGGADSARNAATHAFGHGFTLRDINFINGQSNCASCAIATDQLLKGTPASAIDLPHVRAMFPHDLAAIVGREWHGSSKGIVGTLLNERELRRLVPNAGDQGIVMGVRESGQMGHYFNIINQDGIIRFLDGQLGTAQDLASFIYFMFMPTN